MADSLVDLGRVSGLRALCARFAAREPLNAAVVPVRVLIDVLGLGLEQTLDHLAFARPDFDSFAAWIVATAGPADPDRIARYQAWYDGLPVPAAEVARQAAVMASEPVFSAAELSAWERDGVVVLRRAIGRDEAAAIAAHLWEVIEASPDDPGSWYRSRAGGIMIRHFKHPSMEVPRRAARVAKGFAELYGHADLIASTDRLSFNPPETESHRFPGPYLHWDGSLTPPIPFETQGILYVTDTAADQGALQVVPGFHHRLAEGWLETLEGANPRAVDLSGQAVTVPAEAGDLVIWRHEIPHGASPNRNDRPRLAHYVNHYPMHWPDTRAWL